jgi:membrane-bound serine protease (ClpP class)
MGGGHPPKYLRSPIPSGSTTDEDPSRTSPTACVQDESEPPAGATGDERRASPRGAALRGRATLIARPRPGPRKYNQTDDMAHAQRHGFAPRRLRLALAATAALVGCSLLLHASPLHAQRDARIAYSLELSGTIDPATERWLGQALEDAEKAGVPLAIVRLDTPGGLDSSMRSMVKDVVAAGMPVVVYVSPNGARAASAGLFVTQAADVAAMAPQTNIGSATPIQIGPGAQDEVLGRKVRNDAAAYVRALAEGHGRNPDLAERMVRSAANVTAQRAKEAGLIDAVAQSERQLLRQLDGFEVQGPKAQTLDTQGLRIERHEMPFHLEVLQLLVNPTIASLLLLAGLAGLAIEIFSPGGIAPGVLGAIALILGLYGTAQLPVTATGVILLLLALGLLAAETQVPSGGLLAGAGVIALIAGALVLYDTDSEAFDVSVPAAIAAGVLLGGFTLFAVTKGLAARHARVHGGAEELIGQPGVVRAELHPIGQVFVQGALWRARTADPETTLAAGRRVEVEAVEGLTLTVRPSNADDHQEREHSP